MKIYIAHSGNYDYQNELYEPLKHSPLFAEHQIFLPHEPQNLGTKSKDIIRDADIVVAEVSHPSTGQGIELGWADASGTPVACIYQKDTKYSGSLHFVCTTFISYNTPYEVVDAVRRSISKALAKQ
jgi:nucleoside 2-deoxyribosyltransferase